MIFQVVPGERIKNLDQSVMENEKECGQENESPCGGKGKKCKKMTKKEEEK